MRRAVWLLAVAVAGSAEAQWTPRPTATPRPVPSATPTPTPTPRPVVTATPRPAATATATPRPAATPAPGVTPTPAAGVQTPLFRLRVAPIRLTRPAVGEPIRCSAALLLAGCTPGDPLVVPIWFTDSADEVPADFQLVRVR